jgi:hypothetical protein
MRCFMFPCGNAFIHLLLVVMQFSILGKMNETEHGQYESNTSMRAESSLCAKTLESMTVYRCIDRAYIFRES